MKESMGFLKVHSHQGTMTASTLCFQGLCDCAKDTPKLGAKSRERRVAFCDETVRHIEPECGTCEPEAVGEHDDG